MASAPFVCRNPQTTVLNSVRSYLLILPSTSKNKKREREADSQSRNDEVTMVGHPILGLGAGWACPGLIVLPLVYVDVGGGAGLGGCLGNGSSGDMSTV